MEGTRYAATADRHIESAPWSAQCRIVLVPTFDYEIFHGRSAATPEETLFGPTRRMLERADELGIPFTLFADVCSAWRHRDVGDHVFAQRFERELIDALRRGHDVQLHVHAHWMRSEFVGGEWRLNEPKATLADLGFSTGEPASILKRAVEYLNTLLQPVDPTYRCTAFRAGGLCLQPDERSLIALLEELGVQIDSSIAKDYVLDTDTFQIDYRHMPESANWNISSRDGLGGSSGGLLEVPILTFPLSATERVNFLLRRLRAVRERRGGAMSKATSQTRFSNMMTLVRQNARYLNGNAVFLFSADTKGFTHAMLIDAFDGFVERQLARREPIAFVSMLNHPKLMLPQQQSLLFEVLEDLKLRYGELLAFATCAQIARSGVTRA